MAAILLSLNCKEFIDEIDRQRGGAKAGEEIIEVAEEEVAAANVKWVEAKAGEDAMSAPL